MGPRKPFISPSEVWPRFCPPRSAEFGILSSGQAGVSSASFLTDTPMLLHIKLLKLFWALFIVYPALEYNGEQGLE